MTNKKQAFSTKNVAIPLFLVAFVLLVAYISFTIGRNYGSFQANVEYMKKLSMECIKQLTN